MPKRKGKAEIMVPGQWLLATHGKRKSMFLTLTMKDGGTMGFEETRLARSLVCELLVTLLSQLIMCGLLMDL